jgi:hypothetical protein
MIHNSSPNEILTQDVHEGNRLPGNSIAIRYRTGGCEIRAGEARGRPEKPEKAPGLPEMTPQGR